ncbi:MAG: molybdopterin-dependent oxidoreductase [Deltaproteobacteria bacterium]|nr:molybdopterin-dependent oxidoreductase [Deltaproteobacteria bacterium]MBW2143153.1 molybdopterin-dependent oxidoreductase [Deltaproteobacteria bacterium]
MGVSRRNFIKFAAGGVAGIGLTPLPYKLMDDVAIWTQTWPWVPVPPVGEFTRVKSLCSLCPGGCGIEVRKVDDRAVKIEGRTDYPVNPGGICPIGMGGLQLLYDKDIRYTGPMKRVGPRGSGQFQAITWDEALSEISTRITDLRKKGRPEALAAIDGNPMYSTMSAMIERLTKAVGSPNYVRMPSLEDTYWMGNVLMQGNEAPMAYDLENADYILSFGSGLLEGWGAPGRVMNAWGLLRDKAIEGKAKVVQIESRASNSASKSDQWVAARPGTDAALALGIAHVMIKNESYNDKGRFIKNQTFGFDKFKAMVLDQYSPDAAARITGVSAAVIVALAEGFSGAKAPLAVYGKGKGTLNGSLYEAMAVQSLNALAGNIDKPGGIIISDPVPLRPLPDMKADAIARKGLKKPRLDQAGSRKYPLAGSLITNLIDAVNKGHESPVDTLLVFSANPAYTLPDSGAVKKALEKVPFIVSFSAYQDETSYMADLVLPDHTYLEKTDDIVWPSGLQYPLYGLTTPVVKPIYDTRNTGDVIIQVANRVGQSTGSAFPWEDYEEVLKIRAMGLFDSGEGLVRYDDANPAWKWQKSPRPDYSSFSDMWEKIKSGGLWYRPVQPSKNRERLFKTPTNKFEFFSTQIELAVNEYARETSEAKALKEMGIGAKKETAFMPHHEDVHTHGDHYPLTMVPYEMINLASGGIPSPPFLYKTISDNQLLGNDSFAEINPKTASEYHLGQGDPVIIESSAGAVRVRVDLSEGAMPGIVYMPMGFGHTAYDEFIREKGANPNDIIHAGKDPLSGQPVWWATPVKIIKV